MSTTTAVSLEKYLNTSYHPDRDYVDGHLEKRNVGEWDHAKLQTALVMYLNQNAERFRVIAVTEVRVQVAPTRFRVADVCCVRRRPKGGIITEPPALVIEVLSPKDRMKRTEEKIGDYLAMGVPFVWLIDPQKLDRAWIYDRATSERREVRNRVLSAGFIRVALDDLPEQRDFD